MHRWTGSSEDSLKQAADRSARAARRTISSFPTLVLSDSDEDFADCETSLINASIGQVDGNESEADEMVDAAQAAAAELARQRALPVDQADFENDSESWKKEIKIKFNRQEIEYWFNSVETEMKKFGINQQWDKKNAILALLPEDVSEELMPLLRLSQQDAGATIYKDVKTEILSLFGPRHRRRL